tara:strand:- start:657 stop:1055 length:399 start_codon:yes stop_codon:yes gene_type:complete
MIKSLTLIYVVAMFVLVFAWLGAGANNERECIKYAPPTATPIPPERIYSEWIPMPGYSRDMGKGWINVKDIKNYERTHNVLTDAEYNYIAKTYGMPQSMGSKMGYGFPPRHNFNALHGGVILKNEWLPNRLR